MGWWEDFKDDVLGMDPGPQSNPYQVQLAQQQEADRLAALEAAKNNPPPTPVAPLAPPVQPTPAAPDTPFDPTPYRGQVDTSFSMFTPDFYAKKYADIYNPYKSGVEGQYGLAKDALTSGLAKRGLSDSQQGRGLFQQLDALRDQAFTTGQNTAQGFQASLQDQANKAKDTLYGSIGAGQDNAGVGTRAQTEAQRIAGTASPANTLGDIFGNLVGPYTSQRSSGGAVNPPAPTFSTGSNLNLANVGGGPGASTKVVNTSQPKKKTGY